MANIKVIFKITFTLQLLVCALATYGYPDAELIDFDSPTQPSRDQMMIEAAIKRGMDGEAIAELLRTKKPVVRTTTTPSGLNKTTTYKLEPDGSISSKSIIQQRHRYTYNSEAIPDDIKNSPTGTVTRTFTDNDGNKVTQTISVNHDTAASGIDTDDLNGNWFNKPFASWPEVTPSSTAVHRTRTYSSPNGERRTVQSWSSNPELAEPKTPFNFRRTNTRTYTKPISNPDTFELSHEPNWPGFDFSAFSQPWDNTDPEGLDGWEVMKDPEVTTKKNLESWTPKTWDWPKFPTHSTTTTTTTTTAKPKLYIEPEPSTRKPLPNLDEFLKSQYGRPANRESTTSTSKTVSTTTAKTSSTTPKVIKMEDLPVVEVLHNGKPADESILRNLPAHLTPRTPPEQVINIIHKRPIEDDVEVYTPKVDTTNVRTFSKTLTGPEKPKLRDLDPQMQDILRNAGIVPEIEGDSITKTRTEPDGRIITTTYKVNTVNSPPTTVQHYGPSQVAAHSFNSYNGNVPLSPLMPNFSPISEFLAQLGLTKLDLTSRSGKYSKTLIDENGDVLTATFVLTSSQGKPKAKPFK